MEIVKKLELYQAKGTEASWYRGRDLTEDQRARFRRTTLASQAAKARAVRGECNEPKHPIPVPRLLAEDLMPIRARNGFAALSLFSGGGGLDIGFDRAGFGHIASYELGEDAAAVLRVAREHSTVYGGSEGDVCHVNWRQYRGAVDVLPVSLLVTLVISRARATFAICFQNWCARFRRSNHAFLSLKMCRASPRRNFTSIFRRPSMPR